MATITLITGGARSGKSRHALKLAVPHKRKFFVATGQSEFQTVEEPVNVVVALERLAERADIVVLDCLTLWVSNLMQLHDDDEPILTATDQLAKILKASAFASVVVTDEVGWGIVPEHPMARRYRDLLGWTNQKIASVADDVLLMVSGYPIKVK